MAMDCPRDGGRRRPAGKEAVCILQEALRALHIPMVGIVREGVQLLRITSLQLAKRRVLPRAEADLAEARVAVERQALLPVRWAVAVRRCASDRWLDRVDGSPAKRWRQRCDLAVAVRRHAGIILAVDAAEDIALRLHVPDQVDCCHSPFLSVHGISFSIAQQFKNESDRRSKTAGQKLRRGRKAGMETVRVSLLVHHSPQREKLQDNISKFLLQFRKRLAKS